MISFKLALSLFIAALASQCFALPIDHATESVTTSSPFTESLSVRNVAEPITTPLPSGFDEKHLDAPTKTGSKRETWSHASADHSTTFETGTKEPREFTESYTPETESSSLNTLNVVTRNHVEGHIETETPVSITTVTVPFEKRAFPEDHTSTSEIDSMFTSSTNLLAVQSDKDTRYLKDDSKSSSTGSIDDGTHIKSEEYKESSEYSDETREDKFQDKTNLLKAVYDPSSSTVEVKFPTNQMYHDENKLSVTKEPFTTVRPVDGTEKRETTLEKVKPESEGEFTTVQPVDGTVKREFLVTDKPLMEGEFTTIQPVDGTVKREEKFDKLKPEFEGEFTTVRPVDGTEKRETTLEKVKPEFEAEFTTIQPVDGTVKREEKFDKVKPESEGEFTTVRPVDGTEKRGFLVTDKPLVIVDESTPSAHEKSSTMRPSDKLTKRHEVAAEESTPTLDQGKDTPISEKKESNH